MSPLTRLVPIELWVEVPLWVKGHLDLISHHQPLVGDRLTQVAGQDGSKVQARGGVEGLVLVLWLDPPLWGGPGGLGSDLFWTRMLVYTELLTPEWYSSGGMTP